MKLIVILELTPEELKVKVDETDQLWIPLHMINPKMWGSFIVSAKPQGLGKQLENMKKYIERNIQ